MSLLAVQGLSLAIHGTPILHGLDLTVAPGETLGIVGESGSGKSLTALAVMGLLPQGSSRSGRILFEGVDLGALSDREMRALRGAAIGMVFQEPMTALNPLHTIGDQVAEVFRQHGATAREARDGAAAILARVGLPAEVVPSSRYPHEISGGQRQRVVIAMAAALSPRLVIADEPTTALDVTTQAQILALLRDLVRERGAGLVLISHDLAVVGAMADRVAVMKDGTVVETGDAATVLRAPARPATQALLAASRHRPRRSVVVDADAPPLLTVTDAVREYRLPRPSVFSPAPRLRAVDGVSLSVAPGESLGLVGESGCGKSTLARAILALEPLDGGRIAFAGAPVDGRPGGGLRAFRRQVQMVFQDPYGSFDPRHRAGRIVAEPLHLLDEQLTPAEREERVAAALVEVGLRPEDARKFPHAFSGGQRQRLAIARALITRPRLIVLDEPVSALDVSVRARILDLLAELQSRLGLSYLFISHDLGVIAAITDRVLVMQKGRIVEAGPTETVLASPRHAYTRSLVDAALHLDTLLGGR